MQFTKEQLQQIEATAKEALWPIVWSEKKAMKHYREKITPEVTLELVRIALVALETGESEVLKRLAIILSGSDAPGEIRSLTVTAQSFVDRCKVLAKERDECRMAMLQGAEPVSNRDELPDVELETNESDRHWYLVSWCAKGGYAGFTDIYLSSPWANGSARKVAEIISEFNMVTDLVITSVFPMPAAPQQEVK